MKNTLRRLIILALCLMMVLSMAIMASAATVTPDEEVADTASNFHPIAYDHYCSIVFNDKNEVYSKLGSRQLYECYQYHCGDIYNYYYIYEDSSREYLRIIYTDDDIILISPVETATE